MSKKKLTEKQIETAILTYLKYIPECFAWKNNSTGIYDPSRGVFRKQTNPYAISGVSDILGIYRGRMLAIEVKATRRSKVSKEQHDFIERVKVLGGIAGVCTSVEEAISLLKEGEESEHNIKAVSE